MIRFIEGNLLEAETEAIVNTVNTVGVMGKGLALAFKAAYPENFQAYRAACQAGSVQVGRMFVTGPYLTNPYWIVNFPTKQHWRDPSRLEWIHTGLVDLRRTISARAIRSIAIPPLGCGLGGLDWARVRPEIEAVLSDLDGVEVIIYEPGARPSGTQAANP
jgi:O-acetyl-ADP-ribose deacetylase (regulator of RNase III)